MSATTTTTPDIAPGAVDCELCGVHDAVEYCHEFAVAVCRGAHEHLHNDRPVDEHGPSIDDCTPESVGAVVVHTSPNALMPGDVVVIAGTRAFGVVDEFADEHARTWTSNHGTATNVPVLVCNFADAGVQSDSFFLSCLDPERNGTRGRRGRWHLQGNDRAPLTVYRVPFGPLQDDGE